MTANNLGDRSFGFRRPTRRIGGIAALVAGVVLVGCSTAVQNSTSSAASAASNTTVPSPNLPMPTLPSATSPTATQPVPAPTGVATELSGSYTNSIGMEFIPVSAGRFLMGSPDDDADAAEFEKPQHEVTIGTPFYIGRFEVTQQQWEAVLGSNPYTLDRSNPYYNLPGMAERITRPDHPATVSWNDAQTFLDALNLREGGNRYRLPTEAEWEYAARAGTTTPYSFGSDEADLDDYAWYGESFDTGGTHPVGQKLPNPWGLHDVHGNAWEWVSDFYDPDYYAVSAAVDPTGPAQGSAHVVRGGSWHVTATSWRSAFRRDYEPDYRGISIGFRVVMTSE